MTNAKGPAFTKEDTQMHNIISRLVRDNHAATAVEYALMAVLIAAVIPVIVTQLGQHVIDLFRAACNAFPGGGC